MGLNLEVFFILDYIYEQLVGNFKTSTYTHNIGMLQDPRQNMKHF